MSSLNYTTRGVSLTVTGSLVTFKGHKLTAGTMVRFTSVTNTTGITVNNTSYVWYYVVTVTTDTFQLSNTLGGTAITFGGTNGIGTMAALDYISVQVTFTVATNLVNYTAHKYIAGTKIRFLTVTNTTGITAPAQPNSTSYTWYYVINPLTNSFQLSTTLGGGAITFGGIDGTGKIAILNSPMQSVQISKAKIPFIAIGSSPFSEYFINRKFAPVLTSSISTATDSLTNLVDTMNYVFGIFTISMVGRADVSRIPTILEDTVFVVKGISNVINLGLAKTTLWSIGSSPVSEYFNNIKFTSIVSKNAMYTNISYVNITGTIQNIKGISIGNLINTYKIPTAKDTWDTVVQQVTKLIQFWS